MLCTTAINTSNTIRTQTGAVNRKPTWSELIRCLEEHKAYYKVLATHYAKQLEYVETLLQNGKDFAKSMTSQENPQGSQQRH